jgi:hypothetical protein
MGKYELFLHHYVLNNFQDPHSSYAEDRGISRQEAKRECYTILYNSEFLKQWAHNFEKDSEV